MGELGWGGGGRAGEEAGAGEMGGGGWGLQTFEDHPAPLGHFL